MLDLLLLELLIKMEKLFHFLLKRRKKVFLGKGTLLNKNRKAPSHKLSGEIATWHTFIYQKKNGKS